MPLENNEQGGDPRPEVNAETVTLAERTRVVEITKIATLGKLEATFTAEHVQAGTTVEEFRRLAFEQLAARSNAQPSTQTHHVELVRDERDTIRLNAGAVADHLFDPKNKVEASNPFRGLGVYELAKETLRSAGVNVQGRTKTEIAELAMHATADFPNILADSARKQMLATYAYAQPTYRVWTKPSTTPDFKTMSRLRLGEAPVFLKVAEGAQITVGTMTESREQYAIATYGRGLSFTRQMFINDDLGAFNDLVSQFGLQAARLENKTVYAILNANGNMADSTALFHANHGNLGSGVIANAALDAMFTAVAIQKGLDGVSVLNLTPRYLIVPVAKAATAQNAMTATGNNVKASDQNWFAGRLTVVADAELDGTSTTVWYTACDPQSAPGIEYAHLEGAGGPQIIRKDNDAGVLGVQLYAFLDFGAKAVDWRPLFKSSGV